MLDHRTVLRMMHSPYDDHTQQENKNCNRPSRFASMHHCLNHYTESPYESLQLKTSKPYDYRYLMRIVWLSIS